MTRTRSAGSTRWCRGRARPRTWSGSSSGPRTADHLLRRAPPHRRARSTSAPTSVEAIDSGRIEAEVSDLDEPENRYERALGGKLLEVYLPVTRRRASRSCSRPTTPTTRCSASGSRLWRSFAPITLGALVMLELVQIPLAYSLARRLQLRQREREALLQRGARRLRGRAPPDRQRPPRRRRAGPRRRGLQPLGRRPAAPTSTPADREQLEQSAETVRESVRALRSLIVDLYPPNLREEGLESALRDLTERARERGVADQPHGRPSELDARARRRRRPALPQRAGGPAQRRRPRAGHARRGCALRLDDRTARARGDRRRPGLRRRPARGPCRGRATSASRRCAACSPTPAARSTCGRRRVRERRSGYGCRCHDPGPRRRRPRDRAGWARAAARPPRPTSRWSAMVVRRRGGRGRRRPGAARRRPHGPLDAGARRHRGDQAHRRRQPRRARRRAHLVLRQPAHHGRARRRRHRLPAQARRARRAARRHPRRGVGRLTARPEGGRAVLEERRGLRRDRRS